MNIENLSINEVLSYIDEHTGQYGTPGMNGKALTDAVKEYLTECFEGEEQADQNKGNQ